MLGIPRSGTALLRFVSCLHLHLSLPGLPIRLLQRLPAEQVTSHVQFPLASLALVSPLVGLPLPHCCCRDTLPSASRRHTLPRSHTQRGASGSAQRVASQRLFLRVHPPLHRPLLTPLPPPLSTTHRVRSSARVRHALLALTIRWLAHLPEWQLRKL